MTLASLIGGLTVAILYGVALCRAARPDDETRPTQISYRWVVRPKRWSVWTPARQTVAIRVPRRR